MSITIKKISDINAADCKKLRDIKFKDMTIFQRLFLASSQGATAVTWMKDLDFTQIYMLKQRGFVVTQKSKHDSIFYHISW